MKIVQLTAENVKRLSAVQITPNGSPIVVVAGENEAGKSSVLDAIMMALGGPKVAPTKPVRDGEDRASIVLDLGDIIVTRTFTAGGQMTLKVTNRTGMTYPSPQAMLDGLLGKLTFDPLAFASMGEDQQAATLRALANIDTTALDAEYKRLYDERTLVNRDAKQSDAAATRAVHHPGIGDLIDATEISRDLNAADKLVALAHIAERADASAVAKVETASANLKRAQARVEELHEQLAAAEIEVMNAEQSVMDELKHVAKASAEAKSARAAVPDTTALRARMVEAEAHNARVRENQHRAELVAAAAAKKAESEALTSRINQISVEKLQMLERATFPIEGLGLDAVGVTWNGLPFSQASTAVRVRVSVAIGLALNPKLKVLLVRNGNDLGVKNLHLIAEMAEKSGAQCWVERIAGGDGLTTVVIEDGAVVSEEVMA